jgi:hypothetical protein
LEGSLVHAGKYDLKSTAADRDALVQHVFETMRQQPLPRHAPSTTRTSDVDGRDATPDHLLNAQILASLPRSEEETMALRTLLDEQWAARAAAAGVEHDLDPEEAAWHQLAAASDAVLSS